MELLLGSHVREHGNRVGRLAGLELEPGTLRIRRIVYGPNGEIGPGALARPPAAITLVHDDGEIELRPGDAEPLPAAPAEGTTLTRATRLRPGGRDAGPLAGVEIDATDHAIVSVFSRSRWWMRRVSISADRIVTSSSREISTAAGGGTRAA